MDIDKKLDALITKWDIEREQSFAEGYPQVTTTVAELREKIKEVFEQRYTYDPDLCYRCRKVFECKGCQLEDCPKRIV